MLTYFSIIFTTIIYNYINLLLTKKISPKNLFVFNKSQYYKTCFSFISFLSFFVIGYRGFNLFFKKTCFINISEVYNFFFLFNFSYIYAFFLMFVLFKNFFFLFFRVSFLRLHYFSFMRYEKYDKFFTFLCDSKVFFFNFLGGNKKLYLFFFLFLKNFFKIIFFFFFIKSIFFNGFVMYTGFLPYYAFYYFLFNCFNFLNNFEKSFDQGIIKFYYPDFFGITDLGFIKLDLYMKKLIYGKSEYFFANCIIYNYKLHYPRNWIFFERMNFLNLNDSQLNTVLIINKKILPKTIS